MTDEPRPRAPEAAPDPVTVTDADLFEGRSPLDPEASFDARPAPAARPAE
ncbi:gas vesicle protein K, partial [Streptomyces sp. McG7]|nr:gas vesicle protein K [Streptomyces sp. McG7]